MPKTIKQQFSSVDSYVSMALGLAVVLIIGALAINYSSRKGNQTETAGPTGASGEAAQVTLPATHTVAANETLWSISEKYYGTGYNWGDIAKANNLTDADNVDEGRSLTIPVVTPIVPSGQINTAVSDVKAKDAQYTVAHGDTLWAIAEKEYGTGYKWIEIAKANKLENPDVIHAGNILTLP